MEKKIAIVLTISGPIMGELVDTGEGFELHKPRAVLVQALGSDLARINLVEVIVGAEILFLPCEITYFVPVNKELHRTYQESITGLKLASTMPDERRFRTQ